MARSGGNGRTTGEILHWVGLRVRCTGSGPSAQLRPVIRSLDDQNVSVCPTFALNPLTNREETVLVEYTDQYGLVELKTLFIDETFNVSKIIVFVKPVAAEYPRE